MNDCVGMDEAAVGCVVLAGGLSLPGPLMVCVCVIWTVHSCVWFALHLAAGAALIIAYTVTLRVLLQTGQTHARST